MLLIYNKLCDILNEEVSNPTEIIKSTDIAPKSKQLSNEIFTTSSKELGEKRMIENNLIEDTNCGMFR
ncbi:unnamed protein product [Rhizophagus irregularis]|nr:unnamed protein product [Rhizophagus irregularis]